MTTPAVLAIDGGNSKTDVALVDQDGSVLAAARGGGSSPQNSSIEHMLAQLSSLVGQVCTAAGAPLGDGPVALQLAAYLAGADLPVEEEQLKVALAGTGWAKQTTVSNDTFALLRAGSPSGWGVAVVCGAGINCVGIAPDGTVTRFPALGVLSGDWGGGSGLGEQALWSAIRGEDGRGPATMLQAGIADHFGRATVAEVSAAIHLGAEDAARLVDLVPVLFECADRGDAVAIALVERMADEIVLMGTVALRRLGLEHAEAAVVLGGGVLTARNARLLDAVYLGFAAAAPRAVPQLVDVPPIVGAALLGLDALGLAGPAEEARLRAHFRAPAAG
jgi:N-acetylglucosamine kinase-like BadF-type ATPase